MVTEYSSLRNDHYMASRSIVELMLEIEIKYDVNIPDGAEIIGEIVNCVNKSIKIMMMDLCDNIINWLN